MDQHSLFTPATCFAIACTAVSIIAISSIWRSQSQQPSQTSQVEAKPTASRPLSEPRPGSLRRRRAVDSLYVGNDVSLGAALSPVALIDDLIRSCASVSTQLRHAQRLELPGRLPTRPGLLQELSLLTTALYQTQYSATSCGLFRPASSHTACLETVAGSITDILHAIESESEEDQPLRIETVASLQAQRIALESLARISSSLPLTPPSEADLVENLKGATSTQDIVARPGTLSRSISTASYTPDYSSYTGLTPAVESRSWLEPPPEYSPPADPATVTMPEKLDHKSPHVNPPESQNEMEEEVLDADALYNAVTNDQDQLANDLLDHGADPDGAIGELQRTPLHQAAHLNHVDSLAALLRHGASMRTEDAKGDTPLHLAAWAGHCEAICALLANGADVDWLSGRDGYSPLWCAISAYHIDVARLLLKHGARVSRRSTSGNGLLPLHQAAVTGQSAMCELLLERGAQVDISDDERNTPLHYAAACGSGASVQVLLCNGADITLTQAQGLTPAHWAAHKGHTEVLVLLLSSGAPVDAKAEEGATPLHLAANRGHLQA
ncbi:hypothetical protein LTR53_009164, partial [Teratosphaeriaceae sp. CCFEE 6253]